jgi:hypothetical protein
LVETDVRLAAPTGCGVGVKRLKSRRLGSRIRRRDELKSLAIIFLAGGIPMMAAATLIVVSMRPDLGSRRFFHADVDTEAMTIDWPTLYRLNEKDPTVDYIRALLPTTTVRIPGYMVAFEETPDKNREVSQFLLIPDPGNWLHPPHFDSGDVIFVHLMGGARTRLLPRRAVWVTGRLSLSPTKQGEIEAAYQMWASGVQQMAGAE